MVTKHEVLLKINSAIKDENGSIVTLDSMFSDAGLDSLGTMMTLATIDAEFPILGEHQTVAVAEFSKLTIRDLVVKCILSITNTSTEPVINIVPLSSLN